MNFPDKRRVVECLRKLPSSNLEFEALEVGLSRLGSGSPKAWDSGGLKSMKIGQLRPPRRLVKEYYRPLPASPKGRSAWRSGMAERGIDLGDFGGEEGATVKGREGSECRILEEHVTSGSGYSVTVTNSPDPGVTELTACLVVSYYLA